MVIYGEYLFLENFIAGLVLLFFTGKIAGERLRPLRLFLAACLCGAYAFSMFAAVPVLLSLSGRLVFTAAAAWTAFGKRRPARLFFNAGLFLVITFLYGGITIALLGMLSAPGAFAAEGVYLPAATYFTVTVSAAAAFLIMWLAADMIKARRRQQRSRVRVTVRMGQARATLDGFVDSGNFLRDPYSGRPVAVVRQSVMRQILENCGDETVRYMAIPYSSVGTERGVLDGYRADLLETEDLTVRKPVLAVCRDEEFLRGNYDEGQILLPESMLERGIYADFEDNQKIFSEACGRLLKGDFLHRRKRRTAAAPFQGRGAEDAGGLCRGESGGQSSAHRAESAPGGVHRQEI